MQSPRALMIAVVAPVAIAVLAGSAYARADPGLPAGTSAAQCVVGCNMQMKGCVQTARVTKLACKQDCRQNAAHDQRGACMKACTDTFRGTKDTCRTDHATCIGGCVPPMPGGGEPPADTACRGGCGSDLADCAKGVVTAAKACVSGCRTAPDRLTCLQGCATTAETDAGTCATDFETCATGCAPPAAP
jgi:hypothetical protein